MVDVQPQELSEIKKDELNVSKVQTEVGGFFVERMQPQNIKSFNYKNPGGIDLYELEQKRAGNIPNIAEVDLKQDRTLANPRGPYQIALKAERLALIQDIQDLSSQISANAKINVSIPKLTSAIKYIPNARFAYYNRLLRDGIANSRFTQGDVDYVDTVWMNPEAKEGLKQFMRGYVDKNAIGYTVRPTPPRSGMRYDDAPGEGKLALKLSNPGTILFPTSFIQNDSYRSEQLDLSNPIIKLFDRLNRRIAKLADDLRISEDNSQLIDLSSGEVQKTLIWMMDKLSDHHLTYRELMIIGDKLHNVLTLKRSKYFLSLAQPWKHKTARIPTLISPPSAVFSLRSIVPITTNASGNAAFFFNPNHLCAFGVGTTGFGLNNNAALAGNASSNFFLGVDVGQSLPADFYVRYRLVSSGLKLYCYPSSNNDSGIATISVTFEQVNVNTVGAALASAAQFGDFNQIENGYFKQTTTVASRDVQTHVYIPLDDSMLDYSVVNTSRFGFAWTGYISGASASATVARVEVIMNFEALLDNQYTDYLPSDSAVEDIDPKNVPVIINKIKQQEVLTPKTIEDALREENMNMAPEDIIELPTPPKQKKKLEAELKTVLQDASETLRDFLPSVPKAKQGDLLTTLMDFVNPIASGVIQSVANSINPFGSLGLPWKI